MKTTLETLIIPIVPRCICGVFLETRQERSDGICRTCADASACLDVTTGVIAAYAMATFHSTGLEENIESMTATVNAWNSCTDKDAFLKWMLRMLGNNAAEKIRITAQTQEIIEALEADSGSLLYRHGAELEHFCKKKLAAAGNRRKSVWFLQGTCCFCYQGLAVRLERPRDRAGEA